MRRFWKRDRDRELDAGLRAARSQPTAELMTAIGEQVRPHRRHAGARRRPIGVASLVTAAILTPVIALGGGSAALGAVSDQLNLRTAHNQVIAAPAVSQYGARVNTCVLGRLQIRLPRRAALVLVRLGIAELGVCASRPTVRPAALSTQPLTSVCVLKKLQTSLPRPVVRQLVALEVATTRPCRSTPS